MLKDGTVGPSGQMAGTPSRIPVYYRTSSWKKKHGNADGLSRKGDCTGCRQCKRIEQQDGGPTRQEVQQEVEQLTETRCGFCSCNWDLEEETLEELWTRDLMAESAEGQASQTWMETDINNVSAVTCLVQDQSTGHGAVPLIYEQLRTGPSYKRKLCNEGVKS